MFTGIEHFAIASPDPKRLAEWYVSTLSFRINYEYGGNYFVKAPNGAIIEIIPAQGEPGPNTLKTPGMRHVAISVDSFDSALAELQSKDVKFAGQPYENSGNKLVFFEDADGNYVHLIERMTPLPA
jgi:glyoxylase I family protein